VAIQLDHLILAVNDRKKSVEFYVGILGLKYEGDREPFSIVRVTPEFLILREFLRDYRIPLYCQIVTEGERARGLEISDRRD
jgi:catechol 2,3-dioxygenase-like lactoylglutathione lyase family enzyme